MPFEQKAQIFLEGILRGVSIFTKCVLHAIFISDRLTCQRKQCTTLAGYEPLFHVTHWIESAPVSVFQMVFLWQHVCDRHTVIFPHYPCVIPMFPFCASFHFQSYAPEQQIHPLFRLNKVAKLAKTLTNEKRKGRSPHNKVSDHQDTLSMRSEENESDSRKKEDACVRGEKKTKYPSSLQDLRSECFDERVCG